MTFDQWIDAVDAQLHGRLGAAVKTTELSWDSAMWVYGRDTAVASVDDNEKTATVSFENGEKLSFGLTAPEAASAMIAGKLSANQ